MQRGAQSQSRRGLANTETSKVGCADVAAMNAG